jgi:hypothetical protein
MKPGQARRASRLTPHTLRLTFLPLLYHGGECLSYSWYGGGYLPAFDTAALQAAPGLGAGLRPQAAPDPGYEPL